MTWPSIATPTYGTEGEVYRPQVRTEMEGGYVQTRPRFTRGVRRWNLRWEALSAAHLALLVAAFAADAGNSFSWADPAGTAYTVRYREDSLRWVYAYPGYFSVSVALEEV